MQKIRFGIIGCGKISQRHIRILMGLDDVELVALCDKDSSICNDLEKQFAVKTYINYHDMLQLDTVDVVIVLTSSGTHAAIARDVLSSHKHCIVEKPIALSLSDIDSLIDCAKKHNRMLFEVKQNRFNLPVMAVKKVIDEDWFGKFVMGSVRVLWCRDQHYYDQANWRGTFAYDGGVLANQACHHLDMLIWFLGEVESVSAMTKTQLADIETEDTAVVNLTFKNGALGSIQATTATRPKDLEGSLALLGAKGSVEIDGFSMTHLRTWQFDQEDRSNPEFLNEMKANPNDRDFAHRSYLKDVINKIKNDEYDDQGILKARHVVEVLHAVNLSVEYGKTVKLPLSKGVTSKLGLVK